MSSVFGALVQRLGYVTVYHGVRVRFPYAPRVLRLDTGTSGGLLGEVEIKPLEVRTLTA